MDNCSQTMQRCNINVMYLKYSNNMFFFWWDEKCIIECRADNYAKTHSEIVHDHLKLLVLDIRCKLNGILIKLYKNIISSKVLNTIYYYSHICPVGPCEIHLTAVLIDLLFSPLIRPNCSNLFTLFSQANFPTKNLGFKGVPVCKVCLC